MKKMVKFICLSSVMMLFACSDVDVAGGASGDAGVVAIKDREIAGVTQKGPFLTGSSVTIQELNGETFAQTGKSFMTVVKSNQGDFSVKGVSLVSQYALLEVEGYYRNEVTGKSSDGMVILNALADLRTRNHVNVNLLTHLESGRILNLVQNQGLSFTAAKKQAELELFTSFGFTKGSTAPEDMDVFSEDKGGAPLLAVSVLMLQDSSSDAEFSERLALAAFSFAENGAWLGTDRMKTADWAMRSEIAIDSNLSVLQKVRKNLESWNETVPPFETYVNRFWSNEYGLGVCSDVNVHEVRRNLNENSRYYLDEFVCNPSGRWSLIAYRDVEGDFNAAGVSWAPRNVGCEKLPWWRSPESWNDEEVRLSNERHCLVYGGYFSEEEAEEACPEGYRLPTRDEAQALIDLYGSAEGAAVGLQSVDGFAALMAGYETLAIGDPFFETYQMAGFWTSTTNTWLDSAFNVYVTSHYYLKIDSNGATIDSSNVKNRSNWNFSVRCVRDF